MLKLTIVFASAVLLASASALPANADFISFSHTTALEDGPFTDNFTLPTFDTTLGTLTGVSLSLSGDFDADVSILNTLGSPQPYANANGSIPLVGTGPSGTTFTDTETVGPFSGIAVPGTTFIPTASEAVNDTVTIPSGQFNLYETPGGLPADFSFALNTSTFTGNPNPGVSFSGDAEADGVTTVTYTYTATTTTSTPEPASLALLGFGLIGLSAFRRRKAKSLS
jgi:hypothetical protein